MELVSFIKHIFLIVSLSCLVTNAWPKQTERTINQSKNSEDETINLETLTKDFDENDGYWESNYWFGKNFETLRANIESSFPDAIVSKRLYKADVTEWTFNLRQRWTWTNRTLQTGVRELKKIELGTITLVWYEKQGKVVGYARRGKIPIKPIFGDKAITNDVNDITEHLKQSGLHD